MAIDVLAVGADDGRRTTRREAWSISPGLSIITLRTAEGDLELAAPPAGLLELVRRLQPGAKAR